MKLNENTAIVCSEFVLVPYKKSHVPKYNEWMQSKELQELTASEPLTLKEEYEMQESWHVDDDKLTFIILSPDTSKDESACMVGDVNLFLQVDLNDDSGSEAKIGECEIMIAEPAFRGKGLATKVMSAMIKYASNKGITKQFIARVGYDNTASQRLFGKLGFEEKSRAECFREITFTLVDRAKLVDSSAKEMDYDQVVRNLK